MPNQNNQIQCWRTIGFKGDKTCPRLVSIITCHNCQVYVDAGRRLLDRTMPADYRQKWTKNLSSKPSKKQDNFISVNIFRIGQERLALATSVFSGINHLKPVHSLPGRTNKILKGIVNIQGQILLCMSVRNLLGLDQSADAPQQGPAGAQRLAVIALNNRCLAFKVDSVLGIHKLDPSPSERIPSTLAKSPDNYIKNMIKYKDLSCALIDHELLFQGLINSFRF